MTAQRPKDQTGAFRVVAPSDGLRTRGVAQDRDLDEAEDREDREAVQAALDALQRGELETISAGELKSRLGLG